MGSSRESGSVISFVLIGVVLIGLLFGGLYVSKQRARSVVNGGNANTQVAKPSNETLKSDETKQEDAKPVADPNETQNSTTPAPAPPATASPSPSASTPTAQVPNTGPAIIAATGAEDSIIVRAIIILAIGLSIASYRVSRRELLTTALR